MSTSGSAPSRAWPSTFRDRLTAPLPTARQVLRVTREGVRSGDASDAPHIPVRDDSPPPVAGGTSATWVGHATFVLRIGGLTVLTDPVWARRIPGVQPRLTRPGVRLGTVGRIDAVVISHNHYDHLDAPTIRRLPRETPVFVPARLARWFTRRGFRNVTELDWWESATLPADGGGHVRFDFVPAHHWSRRGPLDTCRTLWGGWVLTAPDGDRVYFAGDTGYGHWFAEIGARYPDIDLALLPIGAYEPRWFLQNVHMNPEEAVRATDDLGAARVAPMHWGTFVLSTEPLLDPLRRVQAAWHADGRDPADLWDLAVGESRTVTPATDRRATG